MKQKLLRDEARDLRQDDMSIPDIAKNMNLPPTTVAKWVADIDVRDMRTQATRVRGIIRRLAYQQVGREKARENRPLHRAGCMLYWGEGTKSIHSLTFSNSDVNMARLFMRFLREEMEVDDSLILLRVQCHATDPDEIDRIERYWLEQLELPYASLRKTQIKKGTPGYRKHVYPNGFCTISVFRTEVVQHIYGAIQEYCGFDNPRWLY